MTIDLDNLETLAKASATGSAEAEWSLCDDAYNPQTVLALIERVRKAEAAVHYSAQVIRKALEDVTKAEDMTNDFRKALKGLLQAVRGVDGWTFYDEPDICLCNHSFSGRATEHSAYCPGINAEFALARWPEAKL